MLTMVKVRKNNSTIKYENTQLTVVLYFLFFSLLLHYFYLTFQNHALLY